MPDATTIGSSTISKVYHFVRIDASGNTVTIATTGGQTINGASTASLASQYAKVTVASNNANWFQV